MNLEISHSPQIQGGPVKVWELPEPEPRRWVVQGLVPEGAITILYGDGGTGKSLIALVIATHITLGQSFVGLPTEKQVVLYIDAELDEDEFVRRAYNVARGSGLLKPPKGLHYYKPSGSLSNPKVQAEVKRVIAESGATFAIFDSLTMGSYGADQNDAGDVLKVMKAIESLGITVLAIDHVAKPQPGTNPADHRPFGSAFKYNFARSIVHLTKANGGGLLLRQTKANFSGLAESLNLTIDFSGDCVLVEAVGIGDAQLDGIECALDAKERVERALAKHASEGARPQELAAELSIEARTVRNYLTQLRQAGRAEPMGNGKWRVTNHDPYIDCDDDDPAIKYAANHLGPLPCHLWSAVRRAPNGLTRMEMEAHFEQLLANRHHVCKCELDVNKALAALQAKGLVIEQEDRWVAVLN